MAPSVQRMKTVSVHAWHWELSYKKGTECGICQQPFEQCCTSCLHPRECPPCKGVCTHLFHRHCMERWIARQQTITDDPPHCPMCRQEWRFHK